MSDLSGSSNISSLIDSDMSGSSADEEPEEYKVFGKKGTFDGFYHETMATIFKQQQPLYNRLLASRDIVELKEFIQRKFNHIVWGEFLQNKLEDIIDTFATDEMKQTVLSSDKNPDTILTCLRQLLEVAQRQITTLMDISFDAAGILEGSALNACIEESKKKMGEVLLRLQQQIRNQQAEIKMYQDLDIEAKEMRMELDSLKKYVQEMHDKKRYDVDDLPLQDDFMEDLKYRVEAQENLNSSLREELEQERKTKEELNEQFLRLEAKMVQNHQERLQEIAEKSKDIELEEGMRRELLNKMSTLSANKEEVEKAVNDWLRATREAVEGKRREITKMKKYVESQDDLIANLRIEEIEKTNEINRMRLQLQQKHAEMTKEVDAYHRALREDAHDQEVEYNEYLRSLDHGTEKRSLASIPETLRTRFRHRKRNLPIPLNPEQFEKLNVQQRLAYMKREWAGGQYTHDPDKKVEPAQLFPRGSPESYDPEQRMSTPQPTGPSRAVPPRLDLSAIAGPSRARSPQLGRAMSPALDLAGIPGPSRAMSPELFRAGSPEAEMQVPFDEGSSIESDPSPHRQTPPFISVTPPTPIYDTQTFDFPPLPSPGIGRVDPTTQTLGAVTNRFDVGRTFNLQTIQSASLAPYSQVTRVDSQIPQEGPSRMTDLPFNVKHTAQFTPKRFQSPVLSKSRFGYTDPTAKVLNLPPGPFQMATPLRQTVVLTSPKREEPLLVNIDVDAKPLEESESGEHFICDISLDLQPGGQRHQQQHRPRIPSKYTYGVPPSVTPSTSRRHGLFTPRGIFKKRHFNVRRVYRPDEYQSPNLPWSPTNIPQDEAGSPLSPFYPSPYYSDRSLSWERPDDYPSDEDSPLIKGPYYGGKLPSSDISQESPSPLIKRPYGGRFVDADSTPESSPSPVIKGPSYADRFSRPDSTYKSSPSPVIKRPPYKRPSPATYGSRSPSPVIQRPDYGATSPSSYSSRSPSPVIQRPDYGATSPYSSRSPSPVIQRPDYRATSPYSSRSPSPVIQRPDYGATSPSSYSSRSPSPVIQRPDYGATPPSPYSSRSPSPMIQGRSHRSPSPTTYSSESPSPVIKRPFSMSPDSDRTSASTPSPALQGRFDRSPPSIRDPRFDTPSSGYEADLDSTGTPEFHRSFNNRLSPDSGLSPEHAYLDDTLNRRCNLDDLLGVPGDRSPSPQMIQVTPPDYGYPDRLNRAMPEDPLNRRIRFDDMIQPRGMDRSPSPQMNLTPERASPLDRTFGSDDSELGGYLEDSDRMYLNESDFYS